MIHLTMVLAKKVSISSDPANVLLSYPNACLSNICSMNMRSFFDCSKNAISYKAKKDSVRFCLTESVIFPFFILSEPVFQASASSFPAMVTALRPTASKLLQNVSFSTVCHPFIGSATRYCPYSSPVRTTQCRLV